MNDETKCPGCGAEIAKSTGDLQHYYTCLSTMWIRSGEFQQSDRCRIAQQEQQPAEVARLREEKVNRPCVPVAEIERVAEQWEKDRKYIDGEERSDTDYVRGGLAILDEHIRTLRSLLPTPPRKEGE